MSVLLGSIPAILCVLFVAVLVYLICLISRKGLWPPLPEDATVVNIDPLQSLAFFVAWTGLVGAITVTISNKWRDIARNVREASLLLDQLERLGSAFHGQKECATKPSTFMCRTIVFIAKNLQYVGRQAERWYAWTYFICIGSYSVMRLWWAILQVDVGPIQGGIMDIPVPTAAALVFLISWSLLVIAIIERVVSMWRNLLDRSEQVLHRAKEVRDQSRDLDQIVQSKVDDQ